MQLLHEQHNDRKHVYTDGSVTSSNSAGAVVIPSELTKIRFRVGHVTSSTDAELAAIREALKYIAEAPPQKWSIFTDSKGALQSCRAALRYGPLHQLVTEIRELFHQAVVKGHNILFQWLPSHFGISGNVSADAAARTGLDSERTILLPLSRTNAARLLRQFAHRTSITQWNTPDFVHLRLHNQEPLLQRRLLCGVSRPESTLLCRL